MEEGREQEKAVQARRGFAANQDLFVPRDGSATPNGHEGLCAACSPLRAGRGGGSRDMCARVARFGVPRRQHQMVEYSMTTEDRAMVRTLELLARNHTIKARRIYSRVAQGVRVASSTPSLSPVTRAQLPANNIETRWRIFCEIRSRARKSCVSYSVCFNIDCASHCSERTVRTSDNIMVPFPTIPIAETPYCRSVLHGS